MFYNRKIKIYQISKINQIRLLLIEINKFNQINWIKQIKLLLILINKKIRNNQLKNKYNPY